jgi:hypothetical protein
MGMRNLFRFQAYHLPRETPLDTRPFSCYQSCSDKARHHRCIAVFRAFRRAVPRRWANVRHDDAGAYDGLLGRLLREGEGVHPISTISGPTGRHGHSAAVECRDHRAGIARSGGTDVRCASSAYLLCHSAGSGTFAAAARALLLVADLIPGR